MADHKAVDSYGLEISVGSRILVTFGPKRRQVAKVMTVTHVVSTNVVNAKYVGYDEQNPSMRRRINDTTVCTLVNAI